MKLNRPTAVRRLRPRLASGSAFLFVLAVITTWMTAWSEALPRPSSDSGVETRGQALLQQVIERNRPWLSGPAAAVQEYQYDFHLLDSDPLSIVVKAGGRSSRAQTQGISYYSLLHHLARNPASIVIRDIQETEDTFKLLVGIDPPFKAAMGNGVQGRWRGYFGLRRDLGEVVIDAQKLVPLSSSLSGLTETFSDYVSVGGDHLAPLRIRIHRDDALRLDWHFRVYEPGLWLFDQGHVGEQRVAWVDRVQINGQTAVASQATPLSVARVAAEERGAPAVSRFLQANGQWLWPSLRDRRGLVYDYRQESPYHERVIFDASGNVLVQLQGNKDHPDQTTQQRWWCPDGRIVYAQQGEPFVGVRREGQPRSVEETPFVHDRRLQHLAMGLALDCALTRLARDPGEFWAEISPPSEGRYTLTLHARKDARLFVGTMLMFTSWAYLHDVGYARSEILCDTQTHRPLEERDYDAEGTVRAVFHFQDYLADPSGAAPGRIRARLPHQDREKKDQTFEMDARFQFVRPGVWLLQEVRSAFTGGAGESTGRLQVIPPSDETYQPLVELQERLSSTQGIMEGLRAQPTGPLQGSLRLSLGGDGWTPCLLAPVWTEDALESSRQRSGDRETAEPPTLGIHRARVLLATDRGPRLVLDGITTASWQEFLTEWEARVSFPGQSEFFTATASAEVRCEGRPGAFQVEIELPAAAADTTDETLIAYLQGKVIKMTGVYHGHGMWYRFMR